MPQVAQQAVAHINDRTGDAAQGLARYLCGKPMLLREFEELALPVSTA